MRGFAVLVLVVVTAACVRTDAVDCGDGVVCAGGTVCVHANASVTLCLDPSRRPLCDGRVDGDACDDDRGRCYDSACVPIACGDALVDPGTRLRAKEACDDGNTIAGDGCAADCRSDETCGNGVVDPIALEICDDSNTTSHDGCGTGCRLESPHWTTQFTGAPGVRLAPALTYEAARGRILMFAGADDSDTWSWDGHGWRNYVSQFTPLSRRGMAMAYDDRRGRVVMYGGGFVDPDFDDLWQWDGSAWSQIGSGPFALGKREFHAMAYDPVRDRIVLFGGRTSSLRRPAGDTWEFDGTTWSQVATTGPSPRQLHAMAYDPVRAKVMLFGGEDGDGGVNNELWSWDGTAWTQESSTGAPPARSRAGMAAYRGGLLVYGGSGASFLMDTWFWDGTTWTNPTAPGPTIAVDVSLATDVIRDRAVLVGGSSDEVWEWDGASWTAPAVTPTIISTATPIAAHDARRGRSIVLADRRTFELVAGTWREFAEPGPPLDQPAITYDEARDEVVVFGGTDALGPSNATWVRSANGPWVQRGGAAPPPRAGTVIAYDRARKRVVMFGGFGFADTWEWDGTSWTDRTGTLSTPAPSPRAGSTLAYDPIRKVTVLFGGASAGLRKNDTWEWDGTTWTERVLTGGLPSARAFASMVWNPARRRIMLFGGSGTGALDDTWEWDGTTWTPIPTDPRPPHGSATLAPATDGTGVVLLGAASGSSATYLLSWDGAGPPEQCAARVDRDGDGLAGCDDPDCWYVCTPLCVPGDTCAVADPHCGDGATSGLETCRSCPADASSCPTCGDFLCEPNETCPGDCHP